MLLSRQKKYAQFNPSEKTVYFAIISYFYNLPNRDQVYCYSLIQTAFRAFFQSLLSHIFLYVEGGLVVDTMTSIIQMYTFTGFCFKLHNSVFILLDIYSWNCCDHFNVYHMGNRMTTTVSTCDQLKFRRNLFLPSLLT